MRALTWSESMRGRVSFETDDYNQGWWHGTRCDFRIDQSGRPWLLEVNANPDISPSAGLARMAGVATVGYSDLIRRICDYALAKRGENYTERWVKTLRLSGLG